MLEDQGQVRRQFQYGLRASGLLLDDNSEFKANPDILYLGNK